MKSRLPYVACTCCTYVRADPDLLGCRPAAPDVRVARTGRNVTRHGDVEETKLRAFLAMLKKEVLFFLLLRVPDDMDGPVGSQVAYVRKYPP